MLLVVPSDPINPRRPDEHFATEADAARSLGIDVALIDHDALESARPDDATARVPTSTDVVYRGWMISADNYRGFAAAMNRRSAILRTTPVRYRRAHEFPGCYPVLRDHTPESYWTTGRSIDDVVEACRKLGTGAAVLKDYVKSMKHYWHEATFIPSVNDEDHVRVVAARFLELRDEAFTGGFVVRRFENFDSDEVRTWWVDGRCALVTSHPDTPDTRTGTVHTGHIAAAINQLDCPFVTVDLARRRDGEWRIIEVGDAQVSDRPSSVPPAQLLEFLANPPA